MNDILTPLIIAYLNHVWRGQAEAPRWAFYAAMLFYGACNLDYLHTLAWTVFIAGYAVMPWQAMFSAITGLPPSRKDHWTVQWVQDLAFWLTALGANTMNYYRFGVTYGAIRAALMLPGVALLGNWWGVGFLGMGGVYYFCGRWSRYWVKSNAIAVGLAEVVMGYFIGQYLVGLRA